MSMYVISHKLVKCPNLDGYHLLQVGAKGKEHYCSISDDVGDNISEKNPLFCELTGLYWIWKNVVDKYIGIVHYRRFFTESFFESHFLQEDKIRTILKNYDVILPIITQLKAGTTVRSQFLENTGTKYDLLVLESVIRDKYPEYMDTYTAVFNSSRSYFRNMLISSKTVYDGYCEWLFNILFEVERRLDTTDYDDYHKRIYGFFSERLLSVYMRHNGLKIYECGVVQTDLDQNPLKKFVKRFQRIGYSVIQ